MPLSHRERCHAALRGRPFLLAPTCSLDINHLAAADFAALAEAARDA